MAINKLGSTNIEEVKKLEELFNIKLPQDYIDFLCAYNGGVVEKDDNNFISAENLQIPFTIDVLFGINTESENADISKWMNQYKDDMLENSMIIGDSLEQGFIVLICSGEEAGIYYWDDSYHFDSSNDESNSYYVARTFNDFIHGVL